MRKLFHTLMLSQVVERAISTVQAAHNTPDNRRVGIVRLNGLLHVDERCAFQEIAKQLCRQVLWHGVECQKQDLASWPVSFLEM